MSRNDKRRLGAVRVILARLQAGYVMVDSKGNKLSSYYRHHVLQSLLIGEAPKFAWDLVKVLK